MKEFTYATTVRVQAAETVDGQVIGVEVTLIVLSEHIKDLPPLVRESAHRVVYERVTKSESK